MNTVLALTEQNPQHPQTEKRRNLPNKEKEVAQLQPA
jgi:hypothetical protein